MTQAPIGWGGTVENAEICDSNDVPGESQYLQLNTNSNTLIYNDPPSVIIKNARYELQMKARRIGSNPYAKLELWAKLSDYSSEQLLVVDANNVTLTSDWRGFQGTWDSDAHEDLVSNYTPFRIYLYGSNVEIDDIQLSITKYVGETTRPILVRQEMYDPEISGLRTALERDINKNNHTITEKRYLNSTIFRKTIIEYEDETFTNELQTTAYESLFTENGPINPSGDSFTTSYRRSVDPNGLFITTWPNGKRADVKRYDSHGNMLESYVKDLVNDTN